MTVTAQRIDLTAKLFRGLADPTRLTILDRLRSGPYTVGDLVTATQCTQPNISNHLRCLRECELVTAEQRGKYVVYQLADDRVAQLLVLADALLTDVAHGVAACPRYTDVASPSTCEVLVT